MKNLTIAALLALASFVPAQACGTLAVTGTGLPSTTLTIGVSGAQSNSIALAVIGTTLGTTTVQLPMSSSLVLGLASPFLPLPIGMVNAAGTASVSIPLPANIPQLSLHGQGVVVGFTMNPFSLNACASNVVSFTIG
jgi:hypothetical protein